MSRKGHGGRYKAPTKEERRKRKAKRRERSTKFIDRRFERWQVVGLRKASTLIRNPLLLELTSSWLGLIFYLATVYMTHV